MDLKLGTGLCLDHQLEYFYFCESCRQSFCQDCAVFNPTHQSHKILRLSQIATKDLSQVLQYYGQLGLRLNTLNQSSSLIDLKCTELYENYTKESRSLNSAVQSMKDRLETSYEQEVNKLEIREKILENEKKILEKIVKTVQTEIQYSSQWQMIKNSEILLSKIKEIASVPWEDYEIPSFQDFISELTPCYKSVQFTVNNFSCQTDCFYSPVLKINLNHWRLSIYPKGNGQSVSEFVSVFLTLIKGVQKVAYYDFRIEIINKNPSLSVLKECSLKYKQGESWGFSKFLLLSQLNEGFIENDSVQFDFAVRSSSYKQLTTDQQVYIGELKVANKIMKQHQSILNN